MIRRSTRAALVLASVLSGAEARACVFTGSRFHLTSPGPWTFGLSTAVDQACTRTFRSGGQTVFKRLYVLEQPARGRVTLREGGYYTYTPERGFRGRDAFELQVCGEQRGQAGCADLKVVVTVD